MQMFVTLYYKYQMRTSQRLSRKNINEASVAKEIRGPRTERVQTGTRTSIYDGNTGQRLLTARTGMGRWERTVIVACGRRSWVGELKETGQILLTAHTIAWLRGLSGGPSWRSYLVVTTTETWRPISSIVPLPQILF